MKMFDVESIPVRKLMELHHAVSMAARAAIPVGVCRLFPGTVN